MKFSTWPKPPLHSNKMPPEIPERFRVFGLEYTVKDGNAWLDIPSKPLDKEGIRKCVKQSYDLFLKLLKTLDGSTLNEIRDLHIHMNEEINKAIIFEKECVLEESKIEKMQLRKEISNSIDTIVNKYRVRKNKDSY